MLLLPDNNFWNIFKETNGAMSASEAVFLIQAASEAPKGVYIELGVAYGKSALAAVQSLKEGMFYLVDPILESADIAKEVANLVFRNAKNHISPRLIPDYSTNVLTRFDLRNDMYSYVMLDSGDHDEIVMQEIDLIKDKVVSGGVIVMHDLDSQFLKVREGYNYLLSTGNYEEIKPSWDEINNYVNDGDYELNNKSWHHPELKNPNFIGALRRK